MPAFFSCDCLAPLSSFAFDWKFECMHQHSFCSLHPPCLQSQRPSPPQPPQPPPREAPTSPSCLQCRLSTIPPDGASLRILQNLDPSSATASAAESLQENCTWHLQPYPPRRHTSHPRTWPTAACLLGAHVATCDGDPWSLWKPASPCAPQTFTGQGDTNVVAYAS